MQQNETSKPCRDHEIDRAFGSRDTSRVAIQPEDGIVALAEWQVSRCVFDEADYWHQSALGVRQRQHLLISSSGIPALVPIT